MSINKGDDIPDGEILFRFVAPQAFPPGQTGIPDTIFEIQEMSCDWERFRKDPQTSHHFREGRNVIIELTVCEEIRNPRNPARPSQLQPDWAQKIYYDPIPPEEKHGPNDAHSVVAGRKRIQVRNALVRNSRVRQVPQP